MSRVTIINNIHSLSNLNNPSNNILRLLPPSFKMRVSSNILKDLSQQRLNKLLRFQHILLCHKMQQDTVYSILIIQLNLTTTTIVIISLILLVFDNAIPLMIKKTMLILLTPAHSVVITTTILITTMDKHK